MSRRLPVDRLIAPTAPGPDIGGLDPARVDVRRAGLDGHAWEELVLPTALSRHSLLWSPAGSGPLAIANQVVTLHDVAHLEHPHWYSRAFTTWYRVMLPLLARRVRKIITVSDYARDRIVRVLSLPPERVAVIREAADDRFRVLPSSEVADRISAMGIERPYLLAIGAVSARKNFRRLFAAWESVVGALCGVDLVVVGKTGLVFSKTAQHGAVPAGTHVFEHVSDDQLVHLYNGALAFVYPSLLEGFGLPVLEAMACGTPVITSNVSALPEVTGGAAVLIDPYSEDAIAEAIRDVVGNGSLRADLRRRGLARAAVFSWEATAAGVWEVLQDLAGDSLGTGDGIAPERLGVASSQ